MPEEGELVLIKIKKILPYGAFCILEEYPDREGFVHISEVASRWIKNIHEFLSEGQRNVAKVIRVDKQKGQIDLSLKQVRDVEKKEKMGLVRMDKRANKLIEQIAKQTKVKTPDMVKIKETLIDEFGDLYTALEEVSVEGESALKGIKLPKKFKTMLISVSKKTIKKPKAILKGILSFKVYEPNGVDIIKNAFKKIKTPKEVRLDVSYIGAPNYNIKIEAEDYKIGERVLNEFIDTLKKKTKENSVEIGFERVDKK